YQAAGELLVEDALLCVTGRLDNGDPPKIIATEARPLDVSDDGDRPLVITCAPQQCTPERVADLKAILAEHPGPAPVHLSLDGAAGAVTLRLDESLSVTRS